MSCLFKIVPILVQLPYTQTTVMMMKAACKLQFLCPVQYQHQHPLQHGAVDEAGDEAVDEVGIVGEDEAGLCHLLTQTR